MSERERSATLRESPTLVKRLRAEGKAAADQLSDLPGVVAQGIRYLAALCDEAAERIESLEKSSITPSATAFMSEERAREILKDEIQPDGGLFNGGWYVAWSPGEEEACLDAEFTAEQLEAIAWWMKNKAAT